jgi:hypothetical protein
MDQPKPLFIVIGLAGLLAMAAGVYVSVVAAASVKPAVAVTSQAE